MLVDSPVINTIIQYRRATKKYPHEFTKSNPIFMPKSTSCFRLLIEPTDPNNLNDKLKNLNADDVSTKAKDALSSIENIALSLPKKLEEAKKLYESRHSKKKASTEAGDFGINKFFKLP